MLGGIVAPFKPSDLTICRSNSNKDIIGCRKTGKPCADCGSLMNDGEAKCFTVCDTCWNKHYHGTGKTAKKEGA